MDEEKFDITKNAVLAHIQQLFEQMEEEMAMSHQEKYALLEDAFEQATDEEELRVAFEQWYSDHADDLQLELEADELWDRAVNGNDSNDEEDEGNNNW
jgi:hypothetical protein